MLIQLMKRWHQIYEARKYEIAERKTYTAPDSDSHEKWSDEKDMTRIINVQSKKSLKTCLHKLVESEDETCAKLLKIAVFVWRTEGFLDLQVRDIVLFRDSFKIIIYFCLLVLVKLSTAGQCILPPLGRCVFRTNLVFNIISAVCMTCVVDSVNLIQTKC